MNDAYAGYTPPRVIKFVRGEMMPIGSIYVGRPTKWGNPYHIGRDGTRSEVVIKYLEYLQNNDMLKDSLWELVDKDLVCYCHNWNGQGTNPMYCHADVLLMAAAGLK